MQCSAMQACGKSRGACTPPALASEPRSLSLWGPRTTYWQLHSVLYQLCVAEFVQTLNRAFHAEAQEFKAQYEASMDENAPLLGNAKPAETKEGSDKAEKDRADADNSKAADELASKVAETKVE